MHPPILHRRTALEPLKPIQRFQLRLPLQEDVSLHRPRQPGAAVIRGVATRGHAEDVVKFFERALSFVVQLVVTLNSLFTDVVQW
jgi:hypothetical protein